jgi:hypothetical protein
VNSTSATANPYEDAARQFAVRVGDFAAECRAGAEAGIGKDEQRADRDEIEEVVRGCGRRRGQCDLRHLARGGDKRRLRGRKAYGADHQGYGDDNKHQNDDEQAIAMNAGSVDAIGDPNRRKAAKEVAGRRQHRRAEPRAKADYSLAEEGAEGKSENPSPGRSSRPPDKGYEKPCRDAEAARNPHVFRPGARHHPRKHHEQICLRQHQNAGNEHRKRHQAVNTRIDGEALGRDEIDAGAVLGGDRGGRHRQHAQHLGQPVIMGRRSGRTVAIGHDSPPAPGIGRLPPVTFETI